MTPYQRQRVPSPSPQTRTPTRGAPRTSAGTTERGRGTQHTRARVTSNTTQRPYSNQQRPTTVTRPPPTTAPQLPATPSQPASQQPSTAATELTAKQLATLERARERRRQHRREKRQTFRAILKAEKEGPSQQYRLEKREPLETETPSFSGQALTEPRSPQGSEVASTSTPSEEEERVVLATTSWASEDQEEPMEIGDQILDTPVPTLPAITEIEEDRLSFHTVSPHTSPRED